MRWLTRSLAIPEIAHDAWNGHSRSLKVIRCCANRRGIYDFLLALNSNWTFIFNRSWDTTLSLHIHTPPLFQVELERTAGSRWTCFGVRVPKTLDYPTINSNSRQIPVWSQCTPIPDRQRDRQTDRQTDGRTYIMAIARRFLLTNAQRADNTEGTGLLMAY